MAYRTVDHVIFQFEEFNCWLGYNLAQARTRTVSQDYLVALSFP